MERSYIGYWSRLNIYLQYELNVAYCSAVKPDK